MDNFKDSNLPGPIEPNKKSITTKLVVTLIAVLVVVSLVLTFSSQGDDDSSTPTESSLTPTSDVGQSPAQDSANEELPGDQSDSMTSIVAGDDSTQDFPQPNLPEATQNPNNQLTTDSTVVAQQSEPGEYVVYSNQAQLDQLSGRDRWLSFHADWCPYCVHLDGDIAKNSHQIPAGVTIVKVDFDDNQPLRVRYKVNRQTTIVRIDAAGNEIDRFVGYGQFATLDRLASAFGY